MSATLPNRILIIDDERWHCKLLESYLEGFGYERESAHNGAEALEKIQAGFDLVLCDITMPGMDGYEVVSRLRANQVYADLPVIMVTALNSQESRLRATEAGANDFIGKPVDETELRVRIASLLKIKRAHDDIKRYQAELEQRVKELEQAEKIRRETEEQYRQILDALPDMVLCKARDSRIVWANRAFRDYYGMSNDQLRDIIDAPFNPPDYTMQYVKDDAHVFNTGKTLDIPEEPVTRHDGAVHLFHTIKSPILNSDGKVVMTVGVSRDITERKLAQQKLRQVEIQLMQSSKLAALGTLSTGVAHELNQPLAIIRGLAQQLGKDRSLPADAFRDLLLIEEQTTRMVKIINHLRMFGRSGYQECMEVDIHETLHHCLLLAGGQLSASNITLSLDLCAENPVVVADANELEQVFLNLVTNARDALEGREAASLTIRSYVENGHIILEFRDNGYGIPETILGHIFDPFFTTKEPGKGTGLGLSISHNIVTKHQGSLLVRNDHGAVFSVILPLATKKRVAA